MITKLPKWVWTAAWMLALVAGMVNAVGLLGFEHQAVSHVTGTASMLAASVASGQTVAATTCGAVVLAFVAGAVLCGILVRDQPLELGGRYSAALLLEACMLFAAVPLLYGGSILGICLASAACGLQNAMAGTYTGAIVRTTHLTGLFTDLGVFLGHWLRGLPMDVRRLKLCLLVISGFLTGGACGALAFQNLSYTALTVPAVLLVAPVAALAVCRAQQRRGK